MRRTLVFLLLTVAAVYLVLLAGSLEPPGPPAPTMRTLDDIDTRIPISGRIVITEPGSYVLTQDITASEPTGTIRVDNVDGNVTIDLNGYEVRGVAYRAISGSARSLSIRNGSILNEAFTGSLVGFSTGRSFVLEDVVAAGGSVNVTDTALVIVRNIELYCLDNGSIYVPDGDVAVIENNLLHGCRVLASANFARVVGNVAYGPTGKGGAGFTKDNLGPLVGGSCIRVTSNSSLIANNIVTGCNTEPALSVQGDRNHVEGNVLTDSPSGLSLEGNDNIYRGNTARGNSTDFLDTGTGNTSAGDNFMPNLM